jgi:putative nucleotidyltransferase with HDIG domain
MTPLKIMLILKDATRKELFQRLIPKLSYSLETAPSLSSALPRILRHEGFDLLIIERSYLDEPFLQTLERIKKEELRLSIIVLFKGQDEQLCIELLQREIIDHLASPDHFAGIYSAVRSEWYKKRLSLQNELYAQSLNALKREQSKNLRKALELEEIYDATVENLMTALDLRDVETFGHSKTVARYSQKLAEILGITEKSILDDIRKGALLHDIGKIAIPDAILKKPGPLSPAEWEKVKLHPSLGYGLIKEIKLVKEIGNIILYHHERYDGTGYPKGLKKEKIPLEARIFALADALDAITAHRPYRKMRDFKTARREIRENSGSQFDPEVVEAFCSLDLQKWEKIRFETTSHLPHMENYSELLKNRDKEKK